MPELPLPARAICDRARTARDARFDGLFFTAVRSTGIYCRPVCPARAPNARNIVYYPTAAAASSAGFRPCLRCRPELAPDAHVHGGDDATTRALALIADGALEHESVAALARRVGVSDRQLRRMLLARAGATPIVVHATRRLLLAKQLLTETSIPITQVALAAGFQSVRRFNAAFLDGCGMAPSKIRRQRGAAPRGIMTLRLAYRPPLDFAAMLTFLARRVLPGIERVNEDSYERVIGPAHASTWIRVSAPATRHELRLEMSDADARVIPAIVRRVRRMFDLDADMRTVHEALRGHPLLAQAIAARPGVRVCGAWDGFETAVRAVLGQQVSVAGATTLARRLVHTYGVQRSTACTGFVGLDRAFPAPQSLADAPLETLGMPMARATTVRSLSRAVLEHRVDFRAGQRLDSFVERFVALPGIGPWTAHYVALRALSHPDAFPAGDLVLQQILGGARRLSERATEAVSQLWRPWRAYAVMHLWLMANDRAKEKT